VSTTPFHSPLEDCGALAAAACADFNSVCALDGGLTLAGWVDGFTWGCFGVSAAYQRACGALRLEPRAKRPETAENGTNDGRKRSIANTVRKGSVFFLSFVGAILGIFPRVVRLVST
jgi:hypothetical protein